jgi:hypothetical protein
MAAGRPKKPAGQPVDTARQRRIESEVKRILAERDPGEILEGMRLRMDEIPLDEVEFQKELLAVAGARYAELKRGRRG